ncbi:arginine beta-hydroxylase, Fe(II)/alpha-ketoglutarate-dependent [compost metagenome]
MNTSDIIVATIEDNVRDQMRSEFLLTLQSGFDRRDRRYAEITLRAGVPVDLLYDRVFQSRRPFAVLKNLPVDPLPAQWKVGVAELTDAVLVGVTHALGLRHFGYPEEKNGAILQDVHPIPGWEKTLSNAGRVKFNLHVESPFLPRPARPEAAALIALNNEAKAATRIAVVEEVNARLPNEFVEILRRPLFTYKHDDSFAINGYTLHTPPSPFLKLLDGFEESRCAIYTLAESREAEEAVAAWIEAAEAVAIDIVLEPGDILVFNNYRCVHGRGVVEGQRWLKRVYGSRRCDLADDKDMVSVWSAVGAAGDHSF